MSVSRNLTFYRKLRETQQWTTSGENCNCPEQDLNPRPPDPSIQSAKTLCTFEDVTQDQIVAFAGKPSAKSCCLDPIPSTVFKGCLKVLLPTITKIVNIERLLQLLW